MGMRRIISSGILLLCVKFQFLDALVLPRIHKRASQNSLPLHSSSASPPVEHIASVSTQLQDALQAHDTSTIVVEAYVRAKRSFGKSLAFIDVVTKDNVLFQALLKREEYEGPFFDGHRACLLPGTLMRLDGVASPTKNPREAVLLIRNMELLLFPRQPQHANTILKFGSQGDIPMDELATASLLSESHLQQRLLEKIDDGQNSKSFKQLAKSIVSGLPELPPALDPVDFCSNSGRDKRNLAPSFTRDPPENITASEKASKTNVPLKELVQDASRLDNSIVATTGFVQNRRRFDGNVTVLQLVEKLATSAMASNVSVTVDRNRIETILHPSIFLDADMYGNCLAVGSRIWISGLLLRSSFWVQEIRLLKASWRPITLRYILDQVFEQKIASEEAAEAFLMSQQEMDQILSEKTDLTSRQWVANELSIKLQSAESRVANLAPELLEVVDRYQDLREQFPLQEPTLVPDDMLRQEWSSGSSGSKWQRQKRPQLLWMIHQISCLIDRRTLAPSFSAPGADPFRILDIGGGKGSLANSLARHVGQKIQVHVLDIARGAIQNGIKKAQRLGLPNIQYTVGDASKESVFAANSENKKVDIVVALHACGHLTDVALGHAVRNSADFCICPCCFSSNPHLRVFDEAVENFLGVDQAEWMALKLVAEVQGDAELAQRAIHSICAIRAKALEERNYRVQLKSFPIQYSTRNICLIGKQKGDLDDLDDL